MLEAVRIRNPERVMDASPHELSGGMGQRVMIAMMLIPEPDIIIADEPTSALDDVTREQFLELLFAQCEQAQTTLLLVSHDTRLSDRFARRVVLTEINRALAR